MNNGMNGMKRSLARAILREQRQLPAMEQGNKLPAIYNMCRQADPQTPGYILGNTDNVNSKVGCHFESFVVARTFADRHGIREKLSVALNNLDDPAHEFHSKPGFVELQNPRVDCPFVILRGLKFQNALEHTASSLSECNGLQVECVTGYSSTLSAQSQEALDGIQEEKIFSYNFHFTNNGNTPVRIVGQTMQFNAGDEKMRSEHHKGVNGEIPVIFPGQTFVCGSTVAFPSELQDVTVEGSFEVVKAGYCEAEVESLPMKEKYAHLKEKYCDEFTAKLEKTHFVEEVRCEEASVQDLTSAEAGRNSF